MFQCSDTVRSTDILGNIVELNTVKIGNALHDTLSYYAALLRAMLYYIKVHYTVLHSTILSYSILSYPILILFYNAVRTSKNYKNVIHIQTF